MKKTHLILGLLFFIFFLGTGQYMHFRLQEAFAAKDSLRYSVRANHIYILLVALLNIVLGLYVVPRPGGWRRVLQNLGSGSIVVSMVLVSLAFFLDTAQPNRPFTSYGLFLVLAGVIFHFISGARSQRCEREH